MGAPADAFQGLSFLEAAVRLDALGLAYIEGSNQQWVSPEVRKNLDYNLTAEEVTAVRNRLRRLHVEMVAYHVDSLGPDDAVRRKVFEFAKSMGAEMIISAPDPASLPAIDKLAGEIGINVAIENRSRKDTPAYWDPKRVLAALQGRSNRIGVRADLGSWIQEGIKPQEALSQLKERVMAVRLNDRTSRRRQDTISPGDVPAGDEAVVLYAELDQRRGCIRRSGKVHRQFRRSRSARFGRFFDPEVQDGGDPFTQ